MDISAFIKRRKLYTGASSVEQTSMDILANSRQNLLDHLGLSNLDPFSLKSFTGYRNPDSISKSTTPEELEDHSLTHPDMSTLISHDYIKILEEKIKALELQNILQSNPLLTLTSNPVSSKPKPSKPPSFRGDHGESIDTWLKQVE